LDLQHQSTISSSLCLPQYITFVSPSKLNMYLMIHNLLFYILDFLTSIIPYYYNIFLFCIYQTICCIFLLYNQFLYNGKFYIFCKI
jgi:hypothetical protein